MIFEASLSKIHAGGGMVQMKTMRVELLHGMTEKQAVLDAAQKLLHETGVTADITGW